MCKFSSNDGSVSAKSTDITHVCVASSLFSFLLYQLITDENTAKYHTYYFVVDSVPRQARERLMCTLFMQYPDSSMWMFVRKRLHKLGVALFKTWKYPFLRKAKIYASDYPCLNLYIGNRPYSYLSDAPGCINYNMQVDSEEYIRMKRKSNSLIGRIQKLVYGDVYVNYYSTSKWCETVYLTEENQSPVLEGKRVVVRSLQQLWDEASDERKKTIFQLFDLSPEDMKVLNSKPIIFFSQPLIEDCGLKEQEYVEILRRVLGRYKMSDVIVKTHPRDKFPYSEYFPELLVFDKPANSQFLQLLGWHPERVVTFFSSSIDAFPESVTCDYFGVNIHPNVFARYGEAYQPQRKVNRVKL